MRKESRSGGRCLDSVNKLYSVEEQARPVGKTTLGEVLRQPAGQHGMITCPLCQKHSVHRQEHICHINAHFNLKPFKCQHCGKCYGRQTSLHSHLKLHEHDRTLALSKLGVIQDHRERIN